MTSINFAGSITEYVLLPVHIDDVPDTIAFLRERATQHAPDDDLRFGRVAEPSGSHATQVNAPGGLWSGEQWQALYGSGTLTADRIDRILSELGQRPSTLLSTSAIAEATGLNATEIRSALSKLSQFMLARPDVYPGSTAWPFGYCYGREVDADKPREYHYYLSPEQHEGWFRSRAVKDTTPVAVENTPDA